MTNQLYPPTFICEFRQPTKLAALAPVASSTTLDTRSCTNFVNVALQETSI